MRTICALHILYAFFSYRVPPPCQHHRTFAPDLRKIPQKTSKKSNHRHIEK